MDFSLYTHWQQLAVCAAIAERSFPNYALYCELENLEHSAQARKMLNKVWEYLRGQLKSIKNIESQLETFEPLIPDPEVSDSYGAYLALDMAVALQSCLQSIVDQSILDAQAITEMTRERLREVIDMQGGIIEEHELWVRHLEFENDVYDICSAKLSHADAIKKLIPIASDNGVSHVGVSMEE